jgi:hypothetical protein
MANKPGFYLSLTRKHPQYIAAVEALGQAVRESGPLDSKQLHLVQLAAAAAIRSGFPNVTASLSWCEDVFKAAKAKSAR